MQLRGFHEAVDAASNAVDVGGEISARVDLDVCDTAVEADKPMGPKSPVLVPSNEVKVTLAGTFVKLIERLETPVSKTAVLIVPKSLYG